MNTCYVNIKAFVKAWETMCGDEGDTKTLMIPSGQTFLLQPLQFQGPCGSSPVIQVRIYNHLDVLVSFYFIYIDFFTCNIYVAARFT